MSLLKALVETLRISAPAKKRSVLWPKIRKAHLDSHPTCAACGSTTKLEVHHKIPFHENPSLEIRLDNLITLCESTSNGIICHLCVGHAGDYKTYNPNVEQDAARILTMIKSRL